MKSRLPWLQRIRYWYLLDSFLAQSDGQPLPYSPASQLKLRLISPSDQQQMIDGGLTIVRLSLPGFSFNRRGAMVSVHEDRPSGPGRAPFTRLWIVYLKKTGGHWRIDQPSGLPQFVIVS